MSGAPWPSRMAGSAFTSTIDLPHELGYLAQGGGHEVGSAVPYLHASHTGAGIAKVRAPIERFMVESFGRKDLPRHGQDCGFRTELNDSLYL